MTNRPVSPLKWALLGTTMTAIGTAASAGTAAPSQHDSSSFIKLAQAAESGEAGESGEHAKSSESGEAGESGSESKAESDADFLADIGFIKGHLLAGYTLYKQGEADIAKTHMKHPESEIYTDLLPELKERKAPEFAGQLAALANAVESGAGDQAVDAAFAEVSEALDAAADAVAESDRAKLRAIAGLAGLAAEEYGEGVVDGKLVELHEYQDAWGFVQIAQDYAKSLTASQDAKVAKAAQTSLEQLSGLESSFKGLVPPTEIGTDPSDLYVAAARIEFATIAAK